MKLINKKLFIFDMDGTLIDSVGVWNDVDRELLVQLGLGDLPQRVNVQQMRDEKLREYAGEKDPYMCYCAYLKEYSGSSLSPQEIHDLRYAIADHFLKDVIAYKPYAPDFLKMLKKAGKHLAIATTTRRKNMDIYRYANRRIREEAVLDDIFEVIYTREDARQIKPHPEIYLRLLSEYGLAAEDCVVFEDSLIGLEAAKRAGIDTVAVYDRYSDNERKEISSLSDLEVSGYEELLRITAE